MMKNVTIETNLIIARMGYDEPIAAIKYSMHLRMSENTIRHRNLVRVERQKKD